MFMSICNKSYVPKDIEEKLYNFWDQNGFFNLNLDYSLSNSNYCITIPPPNITGGLHIGHAMQHTIMDIMIRYHKMSGKNTFWQSGTDHAGIATQILIEDKILKKNSSNFDKSYLIKQTWKWKNKIERTIKYQMKRIGNSIDWSLNRFTMDENMSKAVKKVFINLYQDKLIYRCKSLVNWDCKLNTSISDVEVENRKSHGFMWYIKYPLVNCTTQKYLLVATTRPETIFGDSGIAVNPKDTRYNHLIGNYVILPLTNYHIPIIGDDYVDMSKGTGCLKITPAHDFNDFKLGKKHKLPMFNIFTLDGKICNMPEIYDYLGNVCNNKQRIIPSEFVGMNISDARRHVITKLYESNLLFDKKNHEYYIPYNYRNNSIIEPMLCNQWYVKTSYLSQEAIQCVKNGKINFIPKHYEDIYFNWMHNIKDWCISRSLWWGHRLPVWYDNKHNIYVGYDENDIRDKYNIKKDISLFQENDVLDTWFSSGIWSFASLGWPNNMKLINNFYPIDLIVSGFDIIFFWIARMIMLSIYIFKDSKKFKVPFKNVFITGLICDEYGSKMSKSRGNVIDPLDIIDGISLKELIKKRTQHLSSNINLLNKISISTRKNFPNGIQPYGADTLRLSLASLSYTNARITLDFTRLKGYHIFCNKLWNASKFIFMNINNYVYYIHNNFENFSDQEQWIFYEINQAVILLREHLNKYRFDLAVNVIYDFVWYKFCDWYIEMAKIEIYENKNLTSISNVKYTLITILDLILRMSHPFIPFITEIIWQNLKPILNVHDSTIMLKSFPVPNNKWSDKRILVNFKLIKDIIVFLRNKINNNIIKNGTKILIKSKNFTLLQKITRNLKVINKMSKVDVYTDLNIVVNKLKTLSGFHFKDINMFTIDV